MENNKNHQIENTLNECLENIKSIIDANAIIGEKIKTENNNTIIPISKIVIGYLGGGGEYFDVKVKKDDKPFALGTGAGISINPIGFIVEENGLIRYIQTAENNEFEKIVANLTDTIKSFTLSKRENDDEN